MDEGNSIASEAGRFIASDARQSLPARSRLREERRVALVALGANLGDRVATLSAALNRLGTKLGAHGARGTSPSPRGEGLGRGDIAPDASLSRTQRGGDRDVCPTSVGNYRAQATPRQHRGVEGGTPIRVLAVSPFYETTPVDVPTEQPNFINAVAALEVPEEKSPEDLLQILLQTECEFGRVRSYKNAPRTCDLDLIFFENETRDSDELTLPHPRWKERAFVLVPLNDLLCSGADWCAREPWRSIRQEVAKILSTLDVSGVKQAVL